KKEEGFILVEGFFDLIMLVQAGFPNTVATCGTALTREHVELIRRFTKKLYLCFDGDSAGQNAVTRAANELLASDIEARVLVLPEKDDPDSFVRTRGPEAFTELMNGSPPRLDFIIAGVVSQGVATIQERASAFGKLAPFIVKLRDPIQKMLYTKLVSEKLEIDEKMALEELRQIREKPGRKSSAGDLLDASATQKAPVAETMLTAVLLLHPKLGEKVDFEEISSKMRNQELGSILLYVFERMSSSSGVFVSPADALGMISDSGVKSRLSSMMFDDVLTDAEAAGKAFRDCVERIHRDWAAGAIKSLGEELNNRKDGPDPDTVSKILKRKAELVKELAGGNKQTG
ncbi:MAG: toprim domain-containing protein, partial [Myxococcota bacterium]